MRAGFRIALCAGCALTTACGPKVDTSGPMVVDDSDRIHSAGPPITDEDIEIQRTRTGVIARSRLAQVLNAGVGQFLTTVEVEPHLQEGRFAGWRVQQFDNRWVDVVPGDIITSVNGAPIETLAQVHALWLSLATADEIVVSAARQGTAFELRFTVEGEIEASTP